MKKIYPLSFVLLLSFSGVGAKNVSPEEMRNTGNAISLLKNENVDNYIVKSMIPNIGTRSVEAPQTEFVANEAGFKFYDDLYGNGNDAYWLFFSNAGLDNGNPTEEGQMARILIVGGPSYSYTPVVPAGVYTIGNTGEEGSIGASSSSVMDIFYNPDDPEDETLFGYIYNLESGTITITEENGIYKVIGSFEGALYDSVSDEEIDRRECAFEYTGEIPLLDSSYDYPPLREDVELNIPNLSGSYIDGDYTLTFYGVELDDDGFIIGAGDLFNVELFTREVAPMNTDDLIGTFTGCDIFVDGVVPGYFMNGIWYEIFSDWWVSMGTYLNVYNDELDIIDVGLATDGTITVTKVGDEHKFVFDLVSAEGKKMTGSWQGRVADYVVDFSEPSSNVEKIGMQDSIYGGKGYISAPEDAQIFTVNGLITSSENLMPGIYVVKTKDTIKKVIVK